MKFFNFNFIFIILLLSLTSCASKTIYQVDGMPINDNFVRAKTFNLNLTIKYTLEEIFEVVEDDESYESYKFLSLTKKQIHKIKKSNRLIMNINIFNPLKEEYKILKCSSKEGGEEEVEIVYEGNISRNNFVIELPLNGKKLMTSYFDVYDKDSGLVFKSFKAQYIIER
ncbi:MAG: hypothetical protein DRI84_07465 [Bacteroidetes bacterium]|nr:MAG: hypothetical protein DRI84_07465 [Bacteroidota bacterium]